MEIVLALIVFVALILTWLVLPGSATPHAVETPVWPQVENLQVARSEA